MGTPSIGFSSGETLKNSLLRVMDSYPPLVELQQQITELIHKIDRIRAKEAQKFEEHKREETQK